MNGLKELDDVAYVRFASVYRQFKDVDEFLAEVQKLQREHQELRDPEGIAPSMPERTVPLERENNSWNHLCPKQHKDIPLPEQTSSRAKR